jgi:hypothetical protein
VDQLGYLLKQSAAISAYEQSRFAQTHTQNNASPEFQHAR